MIADNVRATVRLAYNDVEKIWSGLPDDFQPTIYQITDFQIAAKSDEIMNSGVHFDLGNSKALDDLTAGSIQDMESLIRQLNIMGVRLPYPRMSFSMSTNLANSINIHDLCRKTNIDEEALREYLKGTIHTCSLIESITEDLVLGCTWYTKTNPEELLDWGYYTHCTLISLYNNFKDRTLPPAQVFHNKGLGFIPSYFNQISEADTNMVNIPIVSKKTRMKNIHVQDTALKETMDNDSQNHSLVQMELFRLLFLLNTKGFEVKNINPDIKKNKRRKKQNRYPLLSYKVLKIGPQIVGKPVANASEDAGGWHNRLHTCRGHIKIYTIDKPLLGKYSGPVWVRPHIRGKGPEKIIKSYQIKYE